MNLKRIVPIVVASLLMNSNVYASDYFDNSCEYHYREEQLAVRSQSIPQLVDPASNVVEYDDITQVIITTEDGEEPNRTSYIKGQIRITADSKTGPEQGIDTSDIKIKIRGNSTGGLDKKPYNIKFDNKVEILGFSKGKKYCLLANRYDKSFLRNYLAYTLSEECKFYYTPQFRFVDVWLNNKYLGNYLMTTPIETGSTRLDIDVDGNDVLLEREASRVEDDVTYVTSPSLNVRLAFNEPEEPDQAKIDYVNDILSKVDDTALNASTRSIDEISQVIDINSFIDFYIIEEFFKNRDVNFSSTRFYIKDNIFYAGPCWDFDLSAGNFPEANLAKFEDRYALNSPWIKYLLTNNEFKDKFYKRYQEIQYKIQKIIYYHLDKIDSTYVDSFKRDKDVAGWQYVAQGLDRQPDATHEENVAFLKNWLINRNNWLLNDFSISNSKDYSAFYESKLTVESLTLEHIEINEDREIQTSLNTDIDDSYSQDQIDSFSNKLNDCINKYKPAEPEPNPEPLPKPNPEPEPVPIPELDPDPTPEPKPSPTPEPAPNPDIKPIPLPEPAPIDIPDEPDKSIDNPDEPSVPNPTPSPTPSPSEPDKPENNKPISNETQAIITNTFVATYQPTRTFDGKKHTKASDYNITLKDKNSGKTYDSKYIKIKVTGSKNVGVAEIQIKSIKGLKNSKKLFKNSNHLIVNIEPLKINKIVKDKSQYSQDGDIIVKMKKSKVKSVHVLIKQGSKIVKKRIKDYKILNNHLIFSGNYIGEVELNT